MDVTSDWRRSASPQGGRVGLVSSSAPFLVASLLYLRGIISSSDEFVKKENDQFVNDI
jgi:hypothetical protein